MGADGTATFALELDESGVSGAAKDAAGSLEELRSKIDDDLGALKAMQQAMRNLQGGTAVNVQAFKKLKDQITAQKATIAASQEKYLKLGGALKGVAKTGKEGGAGMRDFVAQARAGGGPLSGMLERVAGLKDVIGKAGFAGAALLGAAAVVALTAALVAGVVGLTSYGLAQANAARSERLMLEGMTKIPNWFGIAAGSASDLQDSINGVSSSVAIGRDKVVGYAQELYKMGLRGQNLNDALEATSIAASAAGESYADLVKGQLAGTAFMGQSVKKFADAIRSRFGGVAREQMLDLNVQSAKLKQSFGQLFAGLKIGGFLSALQSITELFSQNSATGRALKVIIETIFNPLIGAVEMLAPMMKRFFQGVVIAALEFGIAVLTIRNKLRDTFGVPAMFKGIDWLNGALVAGKIAMYGLLGVTVLCAAAMTAALVPWLILGGVIYGVVKWVQYFSTAFKILGAIVGGVIAISFLPLIIILAAVGAAIYGVVKWVQFLWGVFTVALAKFQELKDAWVAAGVDLILGLVDGIKSGATMVVDAVKNLAKSALNAAKGIWESHSPSKAWFRFGVTAPQGMAGGIDSGTPDVERSVGAMVSLPNERQLADLGELAAKGGDTYNVQIDIKSDGDPKSIVMAVKQAMEDVLSGAVVELGGTA